MVNLVVFVLIAKNVQRQLAKVIFGGDIKNTVGEVHSKILVIL